MDGPKRPPRSLGPFCPKVRVESERWGQVQSATIRREFDTVNTVLESPFMRTRLDKPLTESRVFGVLPNPFLMYRGPSRPRQEK
jgi:hypothetical protein